MKSFVSLFLVLAWSQTLLFGQQINWSDTYQVKEEFFSDKNNSSGKYLGEIDGKSYYTYYTREKKALETPIDVKISFFAESDGNIENSSFFSEKWYKILDVFIVDNQLVVVYREETKDKLEIKIDYIDPTTFKVVNNKILNSYTKKYKKSEFFAMIQTNEKTLNKIVSMGEKLNKDEGYDVTHFVTDPNLKPIFSKTYLVQKKKCEVSISMPFLTNNNQIIQFSYCKNPKEDQKFDLSFTQLSREDSISFEIKEFKTQQLGEVTFFPLKEDNKYVFSYSSSTAFHFSIIDFKNLTLSDPITQQIHFGLWSIFDVVEFNDDNIAFCYANFTFSYNQDEKTNFYYTLHPLSINVTSFNTKEQNINYSVTIPRYFSFPNKMYFNFDALNYLPFIVKENDGLYVLYNTDINFDNQTVNINESNQNIKINNLKTKLQCTYIDHQGEIEHIETEETTDENDYLATPFCKKTDKNGIQIMKVNSNKISVGSFIIK